MPSSSSSTNSRRNTSGNADFDFSKVHGEGSFKLVYVSLPSPTSNPYSSLNHPLTIPARPLHHRPTQRPALRRQGLQAKILSHLHALSAFLAAVNTRGTTIKVSQPEIWTSHDAKKEKILVKPIMTKFGKFNSNSGAVVPGHDLMRALSHFSWHFSRGELLCDLQGMYLKELDR